MQDYHLQDCMLCGSCSYVCPSNIPLSQMFALSKTALRKLQAAAPPPPPDKEKEGAKVA